MPLIGGNYATSGRQKYFKQSKYTTDHASKKFITQNINCRWVCLVVSNSAFFSILCWFLYKGGYFHYLVKTSLLYFEHFLVEYPF